MRDLFESPSPEDPMAAARRGAPALRKRYYDKAATAVTAEGHAVHLDSKPVHTPAGRVLAAPTLAYLDLLSGFGVFAIGRNHPALRDAREAARLQPSKSCSDGCVDAARNTCRTALGVRAISRQSIVSNFGIRSRRGGN